MNLADAKRGLRLGKRTKRLGRGRASGHGKTSTRGGKGYTARTGSSVGTTYEGGQSPYFQRVAKRGFNNGPFRKVLVPINLDVLELFESGESVDFKALRERGYVDTARDGIKILGRGKLTKKLAVRAHGFSGSARAAIEAVGGTCEVVSANPES